jgi:hypothetical protein
MGVPSTAPTAVRRPGEELVVRLMEKRDVKKRGILKNLIVNEFKST